MRCNLFIISFLFIPFISFGQVKTEWKEGYRLTVLDFEAEPPILREGQAQTYNLASSLDFGYYMNTYEFMLTKNFNKKVSVYFVPSISWLHQGEGTQILLKYAQTDFDMMELYARKYRKKLYDTKNAFSNPNFFSELHDEIRAEYSKRQVEMHNAVAESDAKAEAFHTQILTEIAELAEFCKTCKPVKEKK
ncbi:MAG: hypothetical protein ACO1OF_06580 [Adhaeribacter sp.]